MAKKTSFYRAGPGIVSSLLKNRLTPVCIAAFILPSVLTTVYLMVTGPLYGILIGLVCLSLNVFAALQMILLYRKADMKALLRLAVWCRVLEVITWILFAFLLLVTVLGLFGSRISGESQPGILLLAGGTAVITFLAVHLGLVRRCLKQAHGLTESIRPEKDAFRPAALSSFIMAFLHLAFFALYGIGHLTVQYAISLLFSIILHVSFGCLLRQGSRDIAAHP